MATGRVPTTANSPLTAKGDLFGYSTTQARVAVGNDGETLVADSSTSTGLRYATNFAAGKNKIINGDFNINQRSATSFNATTTFTYLLDRWATLGNDGTTTCSVQAFTAGTAPVAGYEGTNFARYVTSGQTSTSAYSIFIQRIEDVRTYANQTVTISFWAKSASGTPKIALEFAQNFGTGGSSVVQTYAGQSTISTSWTRYSLTIAVPSVSGKTIGAGSNLELAFWVSSGSNFNARNGSLGIQSNTFDIWGVQVEAGSVATAFQTATGTIQGELAACQRYYYRITADKLFSVFGKGFASSTTVARIGVPFATNMRVSPTAVEWSSLVLQDYGSTWTVTDLSVGTDGSYSSRYWATGSAIVSSGLTQFRPFDLIANNSTSAYIGWSAEL